MNEKIDTRIQAEDKKAAGKFAVVMTVSVLIGGFVGFFGAFLGIYLSKKQISLVEVLEQIKPTAALCSAIVLLVYTVVMNLVCGLRISRHIKRFEKWDGQDETQMDKIEEKINYDQLLINIMTIGEYLLFGLATNNFFNMLNGGFLLPGLVLACFGFSMASQIIMQKKIVNQYKKKNPEKRGSVFDLKFNKKWYESCDEAEKAAMGSAARKAMGAVGVVCLVLEVILIMGSMLFGIGILAHILVIVIWLVSTVVYMIEVVKMSGNFKI